MAENMNLPTVSVIMSVYNESCSELYESIFSILNQSFDDFEFIIINDNPLNSEIDTVMSKINDNRVVVYRNEKNRGLVYSLNRAIGIAKGKYIARMDADDISLPNRLMNQINFIEKRNLDLVGAYITLVDENGDILSEVLKFPTDHRDISKYMKFGSCIAHPAWLGRREVFLELNGYRNISYCEDYDFILRAINGGYKTGNLPEVALKYRVRQTSISNSNNIDQYLCKEFLSKNRKIILNLSEEDITNYVNSIKYKRLKEELTSYRQNKRSIRCSNLSIVQRIIILLKILANRYYWKNIFEKLSIVWRKLLKIQ